MASSHHWKRNDTTPISGTAKDPDNDAQDIESATLRFHMKKRDGTTIVNAACNNDQVGDGTDGTMGFWSYDPVAADTDESGRFDGEVQVTFSSGVITTYPNKGYITITISDDLI
jgi:hypothetical protein